MKTRQWLATGFAAAMAVGGFAVGAAFATGGGATTNAPIPASTTTVTDGMPMESMDMSSGMASMMGAGAMDEMHVAMHRMMAGTMSADVLQACDEAHAAMATASSTPTDVPTPIDHAAHHSGD